MFEFDSSAAPELWVGTQAPSTTLGTILNILEKEVFVEEGSLSETRTTKLTYVGTGSKSCDSAFQLQGQTDIEVRRIGDAMVWKNDGSC